MRLIVARCEIDYTGRLCTHLAESVRLIMVKADGTVMVWSDSGGQRVRPQNWMSPPTVVESRGDPIEQLVVRKLRGDELLEIRIADVLSDAVHDMGPPLDVPALEKDGEERDLQLLLAERPARCGEGFRLVRREWPTDIGPVDLMCRDEQGDWIAVEIKRLATIESVEQLTRYLERLRLDPAMSDCRGVLAAQAFKPQARVLAEARGLRCVEVDLAALRGEREPELQLFAS